MRSHFVVCRRDEDGAWMALKQQRSGKPLMLTVGKPSLAKVVDDVLAGLRLDRGADFSITTRRLGNLQTSEPPTDADTTVLMPVCDENEKWTAAWGCRSPIAPFAKVLFVARNLLEEIERRLSHSALKDMDRSAMSKELWVRHDWRAREMFPDAFPLPKPIPRTPEAMLHSRADRRAKSLKQEKSRRQVHGQAITGIDQATGQTYDPRQVNWDNDIKRWVRTGG